MMLTRVEQEQLELLRRILHELHGIRILLSETNTPMVDQNGSIMVRIAEPE